MEALKQYLETVIALATKHIADDEAWKEDKINGPFFRGRLAVEYADLEVLKKISNMVNKL